MKNLKLFFAAMAIFATGMLLSNTSEAQAKKITWITNPYVDNHVQGSDFGWKTLLESKGYVVTVDTVTHGTRAVPLRQGQIDTLNAADLIIFSRATNSAYFSDTLGWNTKITKPIISMNCAVTRGADRLKWFTGSGINVDAGGSPVTQIMNNTHLIFTGVTMPGDTVQMLDSTVGVTFTNGLKNTTLLKLNFGTDAGNGQVLAKMKDTSNRCLAIVYFPANQPFYPGAGDHDTCGGKRMWFDAGTYNNNSNIVPAGVMNLTPDGQKIFLNAVEYMLTGSVAGVPPAAPQNLVMADTSDRTITIKWRKNTEANFLRYRIYRGTSSAPTTKVDSTTGGVKTDTSKTFTGLTNGTRYYLRVTAVDSAGNESPYSNEVNGVPYMNYWLGPNLITNGNFGSATGWTGPLTVGAYTANCVYDFNYSTTIPTGGTAPCLRISNPSAAVNSVYYQAVTLTSGKIYALDGLIKNSTSTSADYWVEFYLTSKLPTNLGPDVVANGDTSVCLAWLKQSGWGGVDNYDGKLSALASFRKDTIKTTGTYYFVIKTGTLGTGKLDAVLDNLTLNKLIFTPLAAPQNLVMADTSDRTITIKWRKNTEANFLRYRIYRGTSSAPITKVDSTAGGVKTDTSKTFTGLTNGTRYYLRVTAVDSAGNESPYSNEVNGVPYMNYTLGPNLITNGNFGSATGWTGPLTVGGTANCIYDFNYSTDFPTGGTAPCLRISQLTAGSTVNSVYYQAVTLTSGQVYALDGLIKISNSASSQYWIEFYLSSVLPTNLGPDVVANGDTTVELAWLKPAAWGGVDNYNGKLSALTSSRRDTIKKTGTYYFIIKSGTYAGMVDAVLDNLTLNNLVFTGVKNEPASVVKSFGLEQNYPNPFNPGTSIMYQVSKEGLVSIKVYDLVGREVATLVNEVKHAGSYSTQWNAAGMCSGIYFYKMQANSFSMIRKMILLK
jgi:hypothetical protein